MIKKYIVAQNGKDNLFFKEFTKSGAGAIWTYSQERAKVFNSIEEVNIYFADIDNPNFNNLDPSYTIFSFDVEEKEFI